MKKNKIIAKLVEEVFNLNKDVDRLEKEQRSAIDRRDARIHELEIESRAAHDQTASIFKDFNDLNEQWQATCAERDQAKTRLAIYEQLFASTIGIIQPNVDDRVIRERLWQEPIAVPKGTLIIQAGPPRSGKTARAKRWWEFDPHERRIIDGDRAEADRLINQGYDVVLNAMKEL